MPELVYLLAVERWPEVGPPNFKRADSESLKSRGNSQLELELGTPSGRWKKAQVVLLGLRLRPLTAVVRLCCENCAAPEQHSENNSLVSHSFLFQPLNSA